MRLEDVPEGERIFVDANILIYHFSRVSSECRSFLARCESGQVEAYTGVHILLEVAHRLMILSDFERIPGMITYQLEDIPQRLEALPGLPLPARAGGYLT